MEKYKALKLLAKAFTAEILQALNENSLRFVDLKEYCPNDRTRTLRLKELRKTDFIAVIVKEVDDHSYVHYQITDKGRKALELIEQLEKIVLGIN